MQRFVRDADFNALSLRDLIEARDHYHVHLANLETVVGTAVGRYRIRRHDKNFHDAALNLEPASAALGPRTLDNSGIAPWSWPCVLVFVSKWVPPNVLA